MEKKNKNKMTLTLEDWLLEEALAEGRRLGLSASTFAKVCLAQQIALIKKLRRDGGEE